jgi:hypothetical protein
MFCLSPTEFSSTFISYIFPTGVAFHCYFSAGLKLKWSVCLGPCTVRGAGAGAGAGDFM